MIIYLRSQARAQTSWITNTSHPGTVSTHRDTSEGVYIYTGAPTSSRQGCLAVGSRAGSRVGADQGELADQGSERSWSPDRIEMGRGVETLKWGGLSLSGGFRLSE